MCGFVGFMDKLNQEEKQKSIKLMADRIIHRGPDEEGYYVEEVYYDTGELFTTIPVQVNKLSAFMFASDNDFVTAVNLDNTGKLTYDLITVYVTDSYTYNKTLTANGTIINITGTTGEDGSRTWSYMTPSHLYTYISGTNTYTFLENGKVGQNLTVLGHIEGKGNLEIYGNTVLGSNATTTYTKVHGRLIVEQNFYTYGSSYLGDGASDNTVVTGSLSVSENATITKNLTVNGNTTLGDAASDVATVKGDLKVNGNTYIGDASSDIVYMNSRKINLENNAITLEFIGLKALWGTIS